MRREERELWRDERDKVRDVALKKLTDAAVMAAGELKDPKT